MALMFNSGQALENGVYAETDATRPSPSPSACRSRFRGAVPALAE